MFQYYRSLPHDIVTSPGYTPCALHSTLATPGVPGAKLAKIHGKEEARPRSRIQTPLDERSGHVDLVFHIILTRHYNAKGVPYSYKSYPNVTEAGLAVQKKI